MGPILGGVARMKYDSGVKICCDGNSLTESYGSGTPYPTQLAALAPLNGAVSVSNTGISGQHTFQMTANASDVEATYDATKRNILIAWEGLNSIESGGLSARAAADDMHTYITARLAAHPDRQIILLTCPPREIGDEAADIALNTRIDAYNVILRNEYRSWGVKVLVDIRQPGSPWSVANFPDYTQATFAVSAAAGWWRSAEIATHMLCHYSTQGYGAIAAMVAAGLRKLPRR